MQNKKSKEVNLLMVVLVPLLVIAISAALILIPSLSNHTKAEKALEAGDLEAAVKYFSKDYIFREDMLEHTVTLLTEQYLKEERDEETMALLVQHGMSRSKLYEDAFWMMAERYCAEGKMAEAVTRLEEHKMQDSQLYIEAQARQAEELIKQGAFTDARVLLGKLGDSYRDLWLKASCAELKAEYLGGSPRKVLDKINERKIPGFQEEDYASEVLGEMMLELVYDKLQKDGSNISSYTWDAALEIADAIPNRNTPNLDAFYRKYHFQDAVSALYYGNREDALKKFKLCGEYDPAKMCIDVLEAARKQDYLGVVTAANRIYKKYVNVVDKEVWEDVFRDTYSISGNYADLDLATLVQVNAELCKFYETGCKTLEKAAEAFYKPDSYPSLYEMDGSYRVITVDADSINDIAKQCGSAPAGKILIVEHARSYYYSDLITYKIDFDWMRHLPEQYRPLSLAEVEYILVVSTDYNVRGTYTHGTKALREFGSVKLIQVPQNKTLYQSKTIYGNEPPMTFFSYGSAPEYKSGGAPNLKDSIKQAFVVIQ